MIDRRDFLGAAALGMGGAGLGHSIALAAAPAKALSPPKADESSRADRDQTPPAPLPAGTYQGPQQDCVAFPMGGMGAGMICLDGVGALSSFSLHHRPELLNHPGVFAALCVKGSRKMARVLEGQVPKRKLLSGGTTGKGLPRFRHSSFETRFPFAHVTLADDAIPFTVQLTGWSPFEPGDADHASLPVAALEYRFTNPTSEAFEAVFSFNSHNFMGRPDLPWVQEKNQNAIEVIPGGFLLRGTRASDKPWDSGTFAAWVDEPGAKVNGGWFRGMIDDITLVWHDVATGACYDRAPPAGAASPGASLFVPFTLGPGESKTIALKLAWFVPQSNLHLSGGNKLIDIMGGNEGGGPGKETYKPWYATRFADMTQLRAWWQARYSELRLKSERFSRCFYDSTLPPEVIDAVAANLSILKSPTVLRQSDGRLWSWEGVNDTQGSGPGSSTHVWNYAQAIAHLFPTLERMLRETELGPNQNPQGHQDCRAALPIAPTRHDGFAAADGQLGGILKMYREWRVSGDSAWLRRLWPKVRASLDYCIRTWDPRHRGWIEEPHLTTYDVLFWGPDSLCGTLYVAALQAAIAMGGALGEDVTQYDSLLKLARRRVETDLFDGEYFIQKREWKHLQARFPEVDEQAFYGPYPPEALALAAQEGPRHQYGDGCLSDGVFGVWLAAACGIDAALDAAKVASHLQAVYRHNLKNDLTAVANSFRANLAVGKEGGLLLCTWPKGGELSLPFQFSSEVWSGVEYQVASHLMMLGHVEQGLDIVRRCRRRYDGTVRNPFAEIEAGQWYGRALSSYALLQGLSGARFDAVDAVLYLTPSLKGDFRCFLSTATGYGTVGVKDGQPFVEVVHGTLPYKRIEYRAAT